LADSLDTHICGITLEVQSVCQEVFKLPKHLFNRNLRRSRVLDH